MKTTHQAVTEETFPDPLNHDANDASITGKFDIDCS